MASTPSQPPSVSVLFVCLGNICRSPMGHAVLSHLTQSLPASSPSITIDSAGTGAYHSLSPPDPRTMKTLRAHGITDFEHAARKVRSEDFEDFDYILAMDGMNLRDLKDKRMRVKAKKEGGVKEAKVMMFGDFGGMKGEELEDPYYGGGEGFEIAYEQCVRMGKGWLREVVGVEVG